MCKVGQNRFQGNRNINKLGFSSLLRTIIRCNMAFDIGQTRYKIVYRTSTSKATISLKDIVGCLHSFSLCFIVVNTGKASFSIKAHFRVGALISM